MSTQYAMPFGAVGAVYAWDRVADLITTILSILLLLPLSRFVDDIFCCVPREGAAQCRLWMKEIVYLLGFVLDEGKTPLPSSIQTILGVEVRFACVLRRKKRSFSIKVRLDTKKALDDTRRAVWSLDSRLSIIDHSSIHSETASGLGKPSASNSNAAILPQRTDLSVSRQEIRDAKRIRAGKGSSQELRDAKHMIRNSVVVVVIRW